MNDFYIRVKQQEEQKLPFVIYKKPNEDLISGLFQQNDHLYFSDNFTESGFIMAPFEGSQILLMPDSQCEILTTKLSSFQSSIASASPDQEIPDSETFELLVRNTLLAIEKGYFTKVVVSRKEVVELPDCNVVNLFQKMVAKYDSAFVYCWFHPKIGLWMGATPEKLVTAEQEIFSTVALAGTQPNQNSDSSSWGLKEKQEQQFVTDYIVENIKNYTSEIVISSPYTASAGNLLHIRTDIEGKIKPDSTLLDIVKILHPTPAVCGVPKLTAKEFIKENEKYDREYYTGYLGEINVGNTNSVTNLFVNLRCMKIVDRTAIIYIGCGVTKDSDPNLEFLETVNKSMTMKNILL